MQSGQSNGSAVFHAREYGTDQNRSQPIELVEESPLLITVQGGKSVCVMRTPGNEINHAAGFCLAEGIAGSPSDFQTIEYDGRTDPNRVTVRLTPGCQSRAPSLRVWENFPPQDGGSPDKGQLIGQFTKAFALPRDGFRIHPDQVCQCVDSLYERQSIYPKTRGTHAALVFDNRFEILGFAEDVGRHNALDKALGRVLLEGGLGRAKMAVMSSRISSALVLKAARARLPMLASKSSPTAMAVDMAAGVNMTLAFVTEKSKLVVLCGEHRIVAG